MGATAETQEVEQRKEQLPRKPKCREAIAAPGAFLDNCPYLLLRYPTFAHPWAHPALF